MKKNNMLDVLYRRPVSLYNGRPGTIINKYSMRINEEFIEDIKDDDLVSSNTETVSCNYDAILLVTSDFIIPSLIHCKRIKKTIEISSIVNHVDILEMKKNKKDIYFIYLPDGRIYANCPQENVERNDYCFGIKGDFHNVKKVLQLLVKIKLLFPTTPRIFISTVYMDKPLQNENEVKKNYGKVFDDNGYLGIFDKLLNNTGNVKFEHWIQEDIEQLSVVLSYMCHIDSEQIQELIYKYFNLEELDFDLDGFKLIQHNKRRTSRKSRI